MTKAEEHYKNPCSTGLCNFCTEKKPGAKVADYLSRAIEIWDDLNNRDQYLIQVQEIAKMIQREEHNDK